MEIVLIFPHHLFSEHPGLQPGRIVVFLEDSLFFYDRQYPARFHKQKLLFHRASMKNFELSLQKKGYKTIYLDKDSNSSLKKVISEHVPSNVRVVEFDNYILEKRVRKSLEELRIPLIVESSPGFLSSIDEFRALFPEEEKFSCKTFYIFQRKNMGILLDSKGKPIGGKWSFDVENRKKTPKGLAFPEPYRTPSCPAVKEAREYIEKHYPDHPGEIEHFSYPVTHTQAESALADFLENRLACFGDYEDAILQNERILFHSVLSPLLNIGLLTPLQVVSATLEYAKAHAIPLPSLEGFLRQIIGWREFIRGVYHVSGSLQRKENFFSHTKKIPDAFYTGTTGILPVDTCIRRLQEHAYVHHIERLMILGNFFLLCEIDPDEVYRWFMEMFIDSYDWVMVPNVYGMSQYADGGKMTTKPYIAGSNYIRKMSDYPEGEWSEIWDALFWRFFIKHIALFRKLPRWNMLCSVAEKKRKEGKVIRSAEKFLEGIL